ncbi:MAG: 8-hydroxy-5-deazaflavin:NADPH oxidoreductase [Gaiellaceae bacterium]|jgi:NADPH-dependent F420 reductase|nr:8-hydroxy-5-deazaflavin:NADPH oxidoreductase [Gaiellaceae bacterium]MDX6470391.1 8-hydroxy-5-deazaflavin:NADPH oxidoreductase [Gaiellaceae bacterium]
MRIAVVGGTGDFGLALAQQLVAAGEDVVIGSRDAERAAEKAAEIGAAGASNADAVRGADIVVLAVKAEAALPTAEGLVDAIGDTPVLSVASELRFTKQGCFPSEDARSIAERTQDVLRAPVSAGLHSLAAASLAKGKADGDALVCGPDGAAKELALELASKVVSGRALDAGPLASARALEGMTAVIVNLNKRYKGHAGVRVVGLP